MLRVAPAAAVAAKPDRLALSGQGRLAWFAYCLVFFASGMEAYAIGSIPVQYFAAIGVCAFVPLFLLGKYGRETGRFLNFFLPFIVWAALITAIGTMAGDYAEKMPLRSTTSYGVYMFLRFLNLGAFAATVYLVGCITRDRGLGPVVSRTIEIAALIALVGLYLYYAPLVGLPEPPRDRIGTQGGAQIELSGYYDFHRAIGTFREASIFAQWLAPLLCLSFLLSGARRIVCVGLLGTMLMLTGSLTGFFGVAGGTAIAALIVYRGRAGMLKVALIVGVFGAIAIVLFGFLVRTYSGNTTQSGNLADMLTRRITPMLSEGVAGTDRDYIYKYVDSAATPIFGVGLGNAGLDLAETIGSPLPGAFLSLYLNVYYSLGPFGVILLGVFLLAPIVRAAMCPFSERKHLFWFLAAYCTVLVSHAGDYDELTTTSALTFAFLWFGVDAARRAGKRQPPASGRQAQSELAYRPFPARHGVVAAASAAYPVGH